MKSFRIFALAIFAAATVPRLMHRGMFVDGVTYASIARNLAEGRGSFWSPMYTATLYPRFHEHPPLGLWLQSLWFRVLGDHLFVERVYALTMGLATAALIGMIWRRLNASHRQALELDWVPVVLWIVVPVVSWAIVGNLLETTVALFTTAAVAAALNARSDGTDGPDGDANEQQPSASPREWDKERARDQRAGAGAYRRTAIGWSILSGLCIVAAGLTKGPVGLFPLAAPVLFLLLPDQRRDGRARLAYGVLAIAVQWTTVAVCALLLWSSDAARASLTEYGQQQLVAALTGEREVSGDSLTIVKVLLSGVLLPMICAGVLAVAVARRFIVPTLAARRRALTFFVLGLSGTLPILVSAKQAGHYLVPAVPLFALAAALLIGATAEVAVGSGVLRSDAGPRPWVPRASHAATTINIATALLILGTAAGALVPALGRDRARLADLDALAASVPRDRTLGLCPEANSDWGLHAWFERRFEVSLDASPGQRDWFLRTAQAGRGCVPSDCAAATDPARQLVLMRCRRSD